ncbi:DUF2306 domain-containing protein [Kitasatospora sp. NPDC056327]|uniref:DUF2306 domain-containing protein n=1 Tax=Kitasatospora sp. NPDC056327 TaxID=3345785 RepID=UPI0035E2EFC8
MSALTSRPPTATGRPRRGSRFHWTVMLLLSVAITGYSVGQYATGSLETLAAGRVGLASTYADRPFPVQIAFYVHIITAGLALAVGPFQFAGAIRERLPRVHRWIGRGYVTAVGLGAAAGLVMSFFNSVAFAGFFGFGSLAVLWGWTTYRGYRAARAGDFAAHRAWMIRSFALTFAAPTLRLWFGVLILLQVLAGGGDVERMVGQAYAAVPFLCWLPNIVAAELMIRRRGLPGLRLVAP